MMQNIQYLCIKDFLSGDKKMSPSYWMTCTVRLKSTFLRQAQQFQKLTQLKGIIILECLHPQLLINQVRSYILLMVSNALLL